MTEISYSMPANAGAARLDAWRDALCRAFGPIEVGLNARQEFAGFVHVHRRAQLQFNEICYRGQTLERTAQNLAGFNQEYFTFSRAVSGPLLFQQNGREIVVEAGSLVLLNQTSPYRATTESGYHAFSISIPKPLLLQRCARIAPFYKLEAAADSPRGQLLINFARHFAEGSTRWSDAEMIGLREHLIDLIVLLMIEGREERLSCEESGIKAAHRERAISYIRHNHCNPQLTPQAIASACGISVGYLNKIFRAVDLRVEQFLYEQRLETCKTLLTNPLYQAHSVQQIAYKSGFNHPSHFSRLFKEKYGVSPSALREASSERDPSKG